ncbi:MAG: PKD domain-containing protein, partial [Bacteroidetes bacterium]|nr:PKD domain-containing protein [Bacteroidota bacterium]
DTEYVYVTVNAGPLADFTNTTICIGDTTFFTDASVGSPIQWKWDFGDGDTSTAQNPSHLYASPGLYDVSLTVSDSLCSNFITKTIIVGPFPIVNLGNDTTVCTSLLLNAKNAGGSYLWNTGETTKIIPVNTTGTYWVDVTSPVGCTTRDSINITMAGVKVNLNVFLEGAYTGEGGMSDSLYVLGYLDTLFLWGGIAPINMDPGYPVPSDGGGNAVDVILIQIRTDPTTVLDTAYAWLMQDGTIRDFQTGQKNYAVLCGLVPGDYYIAVMHRNHLTIMYSDSVTLDNTPPPPVDLTNVINIYGGGISFLGDGPYGMWATNARNSDQEVNANDLYDVSVGRDVLLTGYNSSDVNLTGVVNANDFNIASYNNDQLYQSTVP